MLFTLGFREAGFFPDEADLDVLLNENGFDNELPHYLPRDFEENAKQLFPGGIDIPSAKQTYTMLVQIMHS